MDFSITQDQENPKQILDKMSQGPSANTWLTPLRKAGCFLTQALCVKPWMIEVVVTFYWNPAYLSPKQR